MNFHNRPEIDWKQRERDLIAVLAKERDSRTSPWDCIVPVSGGKDSLFQVLKIKQLGFKPLAVTSTTCDRTPIGFRNLQNLRLAGVDLIEFSPNPKVRAQLNRIGLEQVGDIAWPEHVGIFTVPVRASILLNIPLIVWGENSQNEYGGPPKTEANNLMDRRWLEEFGGLLGLRVSDLHSTFGIAKDDLYFYEYPSDDEIGQVGTNGIFLGNYLPWDGYSNAYIAQLYGFEAWPTLVDGSGAAYENLDNYQHGIHDYFKFLKFGFGRATDILSMQIRRGRIGREQAWELAQELEGKFPWKYLDKPLEEILSPLDISIERFEEICDSFTNFALFEKDKSGLLLKSKDKSLKKLSTQIS